MDKIELLNKIKENAFNNELEKISSGLYYTDDYLQEHYGPVEDYMNKRINFKELKNKIQPSLNKDKTRMIANAKERLMQSDKPYTTGQRLGFSTITGGVGALLGGSGGHYTGKLVGKILKNPKLKTYGSAIGGLGLGAYGAVEGFLKSKKHPHYTKENHKQYLKDINYSTNITPKKIKSWYSAGENIIE